jgi:aspartyl-tRNA(Asn)/glutamyl-tRNA(Gln) amidotransferase subunit A
MTDSDLTSLTLAGAVKLIAQRKISPEELTAAVMSRIERLNPDMCAFITVIREPNTDGHRPPLQGVPLSVKDLYDTAGIPTTAGSPLFRDRIPGEDATVVKKLKNAGGVIVGKANLHEFAFGLTTVNPHFGTARNPWDRDRVTGGSSGGSASAVALGMGFGSMGSDTGGSIRIPAALCGVVGLKPTYGRVSLRGVVPLAWSMDHAGPLARTVEDAAILLEITAGYDPQDPYSRKRDTPRFTEALKETIRGVRVGIPNNYFYDNLTPEVEKALQTAAGVLRRLGAEIAHVDVPAVAIHRAVWLQIATPEAYSFHEARLREHGDQFGRDVRARLEPGRELLSIDYIRAQRARQLIKQECKRLFESIDVLVTPTVPMPAPRVEDLQKPWAGGPETTLGALARCTRFFNVAGLPAISIPCGFTSEDLPLGMQIAGRAFDEFTVLRVAHAYEQETGWFERRPAL